MRVAVRGCDLALPGLDGLDILEAVRREQLSTRVLILSASTDGALVHQAISAGAAGYLSKRATRVEVCDAVAPSPAANWCSSRSCIRRCCQRSGR